MKPFAVVITEYERGWGSREWHAIFFDTYLDAEKKMNEINAKNNLPYVPDEYDRADIVVVTPQNLARLERLAK